MKARNAKHIILKPFVIPSLIFGLLMLAFISTGHALSATPINTKKIALEQMDPVQEVVVRHTCSFEGTVTDADTAEPIGGAQVAFFLGDRFQTLRTTTNDSGRYDLQVEPGRYHYTVKHPDYDMGSNAPETIEVVLPYTERVGLSGGFYREVLVTRNSHKTVNIALHARSSQVLLVTTSLLSKSASFDATLDAFIEALDTEENLGTTYVEVDSADCRDRFGVQVLETDDWTAYKPVIRDIANRIGARTIILLGGEAVVPRPSQLVWIDDFISMVSTDAWYVDLDDDQIVDAGWVISRMPDVSTASEAVEAALQSATDLHYSAGYGMSRAVSFSRTCWMPAPTGLGGLCDETDTRCGTCYATPPYGVCDTCDRREEFFDLVSDHEYIWLSGHGSARGFSTNDMVPIFNIDFMHEVDLQTHHPLIMGYISCETGRLRAGEPSLSTEFLRAGAAAFVARTLTEGTPYHFHTYFESALKGETGGRSHRPYRLGDAMFELMRESVLVQGAGYTPDAAQLVMAGDPTLRRSWSDRLTEFDRVLLVDRLPLWE
jgi:hypothetical protein